MVYEIATAKVTKATRVGGGNGGQRQAEADPGGGYSDEPPL
jgi:hypothetical protein